MSPGRQNGPPLRTPALNQQAKKGVILLADVIRLGYLRDPGLLLHKGTGRTVWNPEDSLKYFFYMCNRKSYGKYTHTKWDH